MNEIQIVPASDFGQKRIGVLCLAGLETFIQPIVTHLEKNYKVRTYYGSDMQEAVSIIEWADLIWFEWANEMAIEITNKVPSMDHKKAVVRLHSYEALAGYANHINWSVVDSLIFVADHIKEIVLKQCPKLTDFVKMEVVPNGV
jgi:protein gp37